MHIPLDRDRVAALKRAYTTRQVPRSKIHGLDMTGTPRPGDLVIARVVELGQHKRLESPSGRRQFMFLDDEILVAYGNRYAPAQYEAVVPAALGPCDLVAAGGLASVAVGRHSSKAEPTRIEAIGFAVDETGRRINLCDHRLPALDAGGAGGRGLVNDRRPPYTIVVAGTSMDSGKTTTAAALIRGLVGRGHRVGAAKVTGTGAGGDIWLMSDCGADPVLDFTSIGMASTYLMDPEVIADGFVTLTDQLASAGVDIAVVEVADGLYHDETWRLLTSTEMWARADAMIFAAGDAAGAAAGLARMRDAGLPVVAVSGLLTASPLAIRETMSHVDVDVLDLAALESAAHDLVPTTSSGLRRQPSLAVTGAMTGARS